MFFKKKQQEPTKLEKVFEATPRIYQNPDGSFLVAVALSQGVPTILPLDVMKHSVVADVISKFPQVSNCRPQLVLMKDTADEKNMELFCRLDYNTAIKQLMKLNFSDGIMADKNALIVKKLTFQNLDKLKKSCLQN